MLKWKYEKFKGDLAIYAFCPVCNYSHNPSRYEWSTGNTIIQNTMLFCPMCGEFLYDESEIETIWNERDCKERAYENVNVKLIQNIRNERLEKKHESKQSN